MFLEPRVTIFRIKEGSDVEEQHGYFQTTLNHQQIQSTLKYVGLSLIALLLCLLMSCGW